MKFNLSDLMKFFGSIRDGVSAVIINLGRDSKTVTTVVHYFSGWLNELQDGRVTKDGLKIDVGLRSIDNRMIPQEIDFLVTGIRVLFNTTLTQTNGDSELKGAAWPSTAPGIFQNGEVVIKQGANLVRLTGSSASNAKASTGIGDDVMPITPFRLRGGVTFDIVFSLAGPAAANQGYKIELVGQQLAATDRA